MKKVYLLFLSLAAMFAMSVAFTSCDKDNGGDDDGTGDGNGTEPGSSLTIAPVNGNDFNSVIDKVNMMVRSPDRDGAMYVVHNHEMVSVPYKNGSFTIHLPTEKEMAAANKEIDKFNLLEENLLAGYFDEDNMPDPDLITITGGGKNALGMDFWPEKGKDVIDDLELYRYLEVRDDDGYPVQTTRAMPVYLFTDKMIINGECTRNGYELHRRLKYSVELKKGWNWIYQIENYGNHEIIWTTTAPAAEIPWHWHYYDKRPTDTNDLFLQYMTGELSMRLLGKWICNDGGDDYVIEFKEDGTFYCDDRRQYTGYTTWKTARSSYASEYLYNVLLREDTDDENYLSRVVEIDSDKESGEIDWDRLGFSRTSFGELTRYIYRLDEEKDNTLKAKVEKQLIGTWKDPYSGSSWDWATRLCEFKADHTYSRTYYDGTTEHGTWSVKDGVSYDVQDTYAPYRFRLDLMETDGYIDAVNCSFSQTDQLRLSGSGGSDFVRQ